MIVYNHVFIVHVHVLYKLIVHFEHFQLLHIFKSQRIIRFLSKVKGLDKSAT